MCNSKCEKNGKCQGKCYTEKYGLEEVIDGPEMDVRGKPVKRMFPVGDNDFTPVHSPLKYFTEKEVKNVRKRRNCS